MHCIVGIYLYREMCLRVHELGFRVAIKLYFLRILISHIFYSLSFNKLSLYYCKMGTNRKSKLLVLKNFYPTIALVKINILSRNKKTRL